MISGTGAAGALSDYLRDGLAGIEGDVEVLCTNRPPGRPQPALKVFVTDRPLDKLDPPISVAATGSEIVLAEMGPSFEPGAELGLEAEVKEATGAGKVLIFKGEPGRHRAFGKVLDIALSRIGGGRMPEEIPQEVVEAVKKEAVDNRMQCKRAQELAGELGVPIAVVGRALDLLNIKITECQLGCF